MRRFEFVGGTSSKFWEIGLDAYGAGTVVSVRFGRIGTEGQRQSTTFATPQSAAAWLKVKVAEKLGKGYVEIVAGAPQVPMAPQPNVRVTVTESSNPEDVGTSWITDAEGVHHPQPKRTADELLADLKTAIGGSR